MNEFWHAPPPGFTEPDQHLRRVYQETLDRLVQQEMLEYYRRNYALEPEPFQDAFMRFMDKEESKPEPVECQHFM